MNTYANPPLLSPIQLLGWLHVLLGGGGILLGLVICLQLTSEPQASQTLSFAVPVFLLALITLVPSLFGGLGLLLGWHWARWLILSLSVLYLLIIPVGTVLGGFGLWMLGRHRGWSMQGLSKSNNWKVQITQEGRGGNVYYMEGEHSIACWWEFGGGDTVAIISADQAKFWDSRYPWASGRRREILQRIAHEAIRQKAPTCRAEIDEESGDISLRQR